MPASRSSSSSISNDNTNNNDGDDSQVLLELMSPDGYYRYLGVTKPSSVSNAADITSSAASSSTSTSSSGGGVGGTTEKDAVSKEQKEFLDAVKKSYRKLSLKHHPDKSGGHVDTFRLLNRAQRVLLDTNLRKQYDLLGIDLDDDESLDQNNNSSSSSSNGGDENATNDSAEKDEKDHRGSASQGVLQEIASNVLAVILQLGVRTSTLHVGWP